MGNKLSKYAIFGQWQKELILLIYFIDLGIPEKTLFIEIQNIRILILYQSKYLTLTKERVYYTKIDVNLKIILQ